MGCPVDPNAPVKVNDVNGMERQPVSCCKEQFRKQFCNNFGDEADCQFESTFEEAENFCSSKGMHLCNKEEMAQGLCCDGVCGIDWADVWISDKKAGKTCVTTVFAAVKLAG